MGKMNISKHIQRPKNPLTARILKALGIFGSLEVITMLCSIIRTKLVAVLIGATGVGMISLYNFTLDMLRSCLQFNLRIGAVREIAAADDDRRPVVINATRRLGVIIGLGSAIVVAALSPLLSRLTFGSSQYTWTFLVLSLTMVASAISASRTAILQAQDRLRSLARVSLAGAVISSGLAIPLFYFFRLDAIVPVVLIFPFATMLCVLIPHVKFQRHIPRQEINAASKSILKLGAYLTVALAATSLAEYLLRIYINSTESTQTVGIFQSGYTIINSYVGILFTAMAMEYYPRLSAHIQSRPRHVSLLVNHEISVMMWVLIPIVVLFLAADELLVRVLYASDFLAVLPFISFAIIGVILRAVSWSLAYVILARGDGRIYVVTEITSATLMLVLFIAGWRLWGFVGLGLAYICEFFLYTIITGAVCRRYGVKLNKNIIRLILLALGISAIALTLRYTCGWWAPALMLIGLVPLSLKALKK